MTIIIDAYNYLKNVLHVTFVHESQIAACIREYIQYTLLRNNEIMLIFDAGPYDQITYENVAQQVVVYYSGAWSSADDVIKDIIIEKQHEDILLVTSDRELCAFADAHNIISIGVLDFHHIWQAVMKACKNTQVRLDNTIIKMTSEENAYIDHLMELGSRTLVPKNETMHSKIDQAQLIEIMEKNKKISKLDKKLLKKLNKI